MVKRKFSSGLPKLDTFVGGFLPGDTFLTFFTEYRHWAQIIGYTIQYAVESNSPIVYISCTNLFTHLLGDYRKAQHLQFHDRNITSTSFLRVVKKTLASAPKRAVIILDELSTWNNLLGSERDILDLFDVVAEVTNKQQGFLLCSARRTSFKRESLARLKDDASVAIEISSNNDEPYCVLRSSKMRYTFHGIVPLRLKFSELSKQTLPGNDTIPEQPGRQDAQFLRSIFSLEKSSQYLFDKAAQPMVLFKLLGDYREFNAAAVELFDQPVEDLQLKPVTDFIVPHQRFKALRFLTELQRKRKHSATFTCIRKDRSTLPVVIRCSDVGNGFVLAILQDITEQVKSQETSVLSQQAFGALLNRAAVGILVVNNNRLLYANERFLTLWGFSAGEDLRSRSIKDFLSSSSFKLFQMKTRDLEVDGSLIQSFDVQALKSDQSIIDCIISLSTVVFEGKHCIQASFIDVSVQKRIVSTLTVSEQKYRSAVERSLVAVAMVQDGRYEYVNKAFWELFAMDSADEMMGRELSSIVEEDYLDQFSNFITKRSQKLTEPRTLECVAVRKGASPFDAEISIVQIQNDNRMILFCRDITKEKKLRVELEQHVDELSILEEIHRSFSTSFEVREILSHGMHKLMDVLGYEIGALYLVDEKKKDLQLSFHRSLPESLSKKLQPLPIDEGLGGFLSKTQEPLTFPMKKYPSYLPFRSAFEGLAIQSICLLPLLMKEKFIGCILLCSKRDHASHRQSLELLKAISGQIGSLIGHALSFQQISEREQQRQSLIESLSEILYTALPTGAMQFVSGSVEQLVGYSSKEFYRNPNLWLNLVHPDDKRIILERTTRLNELTWPFVSEYRVVPKGKATPCWVQDVVNCVKDEGGNIVLLQGRVSDITHLKELISQLQNANELHTSILSSIQEGVVVCDSNLKCLQWNQSMEKLTGIASTEVVGKQLSAALTGVEPQEIKKLLHQALEGNIVTTEDHRYVNSKTKVEMYLSGRYSPLRTPSGEIIGVVGILSNVVERRKLENEMRESEQVLRNVIDTMGDVLLITDLKGGVMEVNQTFLRVLGYSRAEVAGVEFPYPWLLDEEMGRFVLWIAELRDKNWLHDFDMTWRAKDNHLIPMSLSTTLLRNSMGEPIAMLNIARDITERTRLAKDLEHRNIQIEMINRIVNKANQTLDFDEIFHAIAEEIDAVVPCDSINVALLNEDDAVLSIYSLKGTQALQKGDTVPLNQSVTQFAFEAKRPIIVDDLSGDPKYRSLRSYHRGLKSQISIPIILKDRPFGALNIASMSSKLYTEEHTQLLQPLAQQIGTIVDRVRLFQQVTDDSTYIHNLLDSIDSIVYTVDNQYRIREVNQAWHAFMQESGFPGIRNYQGMNLFEVLPNDSLNTMFRGVIDHLVDGSIRIFSQEFVSPGRDGDRTYQITINPMVIERKIKGLVFTHTDISTLKKAEAELKKSYEQLLTLNEISTLINTSLDLDEILQTAIPLLKKDVHADAVLVYLIDQIEKDILLAKQVGFDDVDSSSLRRLKQGSSVTGSVILTKEPLYITEQVYLDERILSQNREVLRKTNLQALAVIPLISKDKVLGALDVFYNSAHEFSDQDRQIFSLLGNQLGTAIENAQLYGELRSQIGRLTVLYELSQQLTSTLDIDQIFQAIQESVQRVVSFETFNIELYDSTLNSLKSVYRVSAFDDQKHVEHDSGMMRPIMTNSPEEHVVTTKRSFHDQKWSSMFVPMLSKETIIGMMSVSDSNANQYTDTHLRLLESIGNLVAIALEKAKLYEETVKISLEIQRRNKELDDFTYVVSHDLKEPLISIEGYSRILQLDYRETIQGEGKEYLDSIVGATTRMKGLIDDLLMLSRVSRPGEALKSVSIEQIIEDIQTDMEFKLKQKGVTFVIPPNLPTIQGNETQLKAVFRNLIGNAVKFNNKPNPVVEIGFQNAENNSYLFSVKDNGIGIPKEFYEKVFVIFQRLHRREEYEGSGAGLAIVKKIIEMHKGKIWVESEEGQGTTFFFTIPKTD
jgi:PAS domain S-box-containing protein